ncbi:MAG: serine protease [Myxococcota bacterium]
MYHSMTKLALLACVCTAMACGSEDEFIEVGGVDAVSEPIINGYIASQGFVVRQGALYTRSGNGYVFICGATYAGRNGAGEHWVLTAAHCVENTRGDYLVAFGKADRSQYTFADTVSVESVTIAPGYRFGQVSPNDIALLRVSGQPNATRSVMASSSTDASIGETVLISGFGRTESGSSSNVLLSADTNVISTTECRRWFPSVDSTQICILDDAGVQQNACNGDSGGPLFRTNATQVGLTSFGRTGCPVTAPAVYTRISAFRSWINSVSGL